MSNLKTTDHEYNYNSAITLCLGSPKDIGYGKEIIHKIQLGLD